MKKGLTEIVFILDRSGSMGGLESDTIGGYNEMLKKQKQLEGEALVSTVLFDEQFEVLHNRIPIAQVRSITDREYFVRGGTALLDAIGRSITKIGTIQKNTPEEEKDEKVIFIITTDGMENSSREYSADHVKLMIERQKEKFGWEFLFLGANIDAVETAEKIGISANHAVNYHADSKGTRLNYATVGKAISQFREESCIDDHWKDEIDKDFKNRSKA